MYDCYAECRLHSGLIETGECSASVGWLKLRGSNGPVKEIAPLGNVNYIEALSRLFFDSWKFTGELVQCIKVRPGYREEL